MDWRTAPLLKAPQDDPHFASCVAGSRLSDSDARALRETLTPDSSSLAARLQLIGYFTRNGLHGDEHVLWLIRTNPRVRIGFFWALHEEAADEGLRLWTEIVRTTRDAWICANAAWSTSTVDVAFAEHAYDCGDAMAGADSEWFCTKAAFFETGVARAEASSPRAARLARRALGALLTAIERDEDPAHQLALIWSARRYAHEGGASEQLALLRVADREAKRARRIGARDRPEEHAYLTAMGLVALAHDDRGAAARRLLDSARALEAENVPSFALARALCAAGAVEPVADFLSTLRARLPRLADTLSTWIDEVRAGSLPSFDVSAAHR